MSILGSDTFQRANQSGSWGTASDGQSWVRVSGSATPAISSNQGTLTGSTTLTQMFLGSRTSRDFDIRVRFSYTGTTDTVSITARATATNTAYRARITNNNFGITKVLSGTTTLLTGGVFTITLGNFYWIRFASFGSDLRAKIWQDGDPEPAEWRRDTVDTDILDAGQFGIHVQLTAAGNVARFDQLHAVDYLLESILPLQQTLRCVQTQSKQADLLFFDVQLFQIQPFFLESLLLGDELLEPSPIKTMSFTNTLLLLTTLFSTHQYHSEEIAPLLTAMRRTTLSSLSVTSLPNSFLALTIHHFPTEALSLLTLLEMITIIINQMVALDQLLFVALLNGFSLKQTDSLLSLESLTIIEKHFVLSYLFLLTLSRLENKAAFFAEELSLQALRRVEAIVLRMHLLVLTGEQHMQRELALQETGAFLSQREYLHTSRIHLLLILAAQDGSLRATQFNNPLSLNGQQQGEGMYQPDNTLLLLEQKGMQNETLLQEELRLHDLVMLIQQRQILEQLLLHAHSQQQAHALFFDTPQVQIILRSHINPGIRNLLNLDELSSWATEQTPANLLALAQNIEHAHLSAFLILHPVRNLPLWGRASSHAELIALLDSLLGAVNPIIFLNTTSLVLVVRDGRVVLWSRDGSLQPLIRDGRVSLRGR